MKPLFITGIDTGIGKTIISAILVEKLQADYWKPVQSGDLDNSDTQKVKSLISNSQSEFHPETYRFSQPFSPHKAADLDGMHAEARNINMPVTTKKLVIEGAGGLMVPLNETELIIDLIKKFEAEVILVSKNYLGSINHTLLSIDALRTRNITVRGIIFNGEPDNYSEELIIKYSGINSFARIPFTEPLDQEAIISLGNYLAPLNL